MYYILTVLITPEEKCIDKTILVHAGLNAVGQAAITIALAKGYTVYASVENEKQQMLLKKKFPSVRCKYININTAYPKNSLLGI